ncbi:MAG: sugar phosphate nucleotidyltransferase [Candidatus Nitrosoabyssus spongiisocia]|nr:MAG: sugar phosphate nucleotidyltransferase [Nitrosopumilaceae archaeon AB1(1)]
MNKIKKCVITAAGTGTRLLPFTKENSKEMMPIYAKNKNQILLKPILQVIYESIFDFGINNFCFVVGRGKRNVEDHFLISEKNKLKNNAAMKTFFQKVGKSNINYVQQSVSRGFGDAVAKSKFFVNNNDFLLHAGDDVILSPNNDHLQRLEKAFFEYDADVAFLVTEISDPESYGVIQGNEIKKGIIRVDSFEEKPKKPKSKLAVIAIYIFKSSVFKTLKKTKPDKKGEIRLADAVKSIISNGNAIAVKLKNNEKRIDVGIPENYVDSINTSYQFFNKK